MTRKCTARHDETDAVDRCCVRAEGGHLEHLDPHGHVWTRGMVTDRDQAAQEVQAWVKVRDLVRQVEDALDATNPGSEAVEGIVWDFLRMPIGSGLHRVKEAVDDVVAVYADLGLVE